MSGRSRAIAIITTALGLLGACSGSEGPGGAPSGQGATGGSGAVGATAGSGGGAGTSNVSGTGGAAGDNGAGGGASGSGASGTSGTSTSGAAGGGAAGAGSGGTSAASGSGGQAPEADLELTAVAANQSVGLEWNATEGADGYRVHYAAGTAATPSDPALDVEAPHTTLVHRGLTNGTEYHYLVTAVTGGVESVPSNEATATPEGEWVMEELGSGIFEDVSTGMPVPHVPFASRVHVLLFAEGYTEANLDVFHTVATHDGSRGNDVDRWVDEVFRIPPYSDFREAFVIWYLPRASNTDSTGGDTAFSVGVTNGGVSGVTSTGETATRAWAAIGLHPSPPTDFTGGGFGTVRTHVASFLVFDPQSGRAGISGLTTSLRNPSATQQRIAAAFALGQAHEFTHAFSALRDEYLEDDNAAPSSTSDQSNVAGTNVCGEFPWSHLLEGGSINPDTAELVGAFGRSTHGFHSELLCLLNGTHDNATYYGGNGTLRPNDRMCNFCREVTAYYVYARTSVLPVTTAGFDTWKSDYRDAYFARFPFFVPEVVPQTNDVRNPAQGMPIYEACTAADRTIPRLQTAAPPAGPRRSGCIIEDG